MNIASGDRLARAFGGMPQASATSSPVEGVDEIDIRDRRGARVSTRVITRSPSELSLVLLGGAGTSLAAAKKIADETLRLRQA